MKLDELPLLPASPPLGLAVVVASLLVACLTFEILLRALPSHLRGYDLDGRTFVHPREFVPDRSENSLGFHDVDHVPPANGRAVVFLVGDSYVEASSVLVSQTVGRRLEEHLEAQSARPHEVVSIGHSGWGPEQELRALKKLAPTFGPDVVVTLFLTLNDVLDSSPELIRRQGETTTRLLRHRPGWLSLRFEDAPLLLCERSELNRFVSLHVGLWSSRRQAQDSGKAGIPVAYSVYRQDYDAAWEAAWKRTEELIAATKRYTSEMGARYLVVSASTPQGVLGPERGLDELTYSYPSMKDFSWDLDKADRLLREICQRHEIPCLLLEPVFRHEVAGGTRLHWRHDGHWNADGNELAGRMIATFVLSQPG